MIVSLTVGSLSNANLVTWQPRSLVSARRFDSGVQGLVALFKVLGGHPKTGQ